MEERQLLDQIIEALVSLDPGKVESLVENGLNSGIDPLIIINDGITAGLTRLGGLFEEEQIFLPELVLGGKIGSDALDALKPKLSLPAPVLIRNP